MVWFHDLTKKINMRGMNEEGRGCCCCRMGMKVASDVVFEFWTAFPSPNVDGGHRARQDARKGPRPFQLSRTSLSVLRSPSSFFLFLCLPAPRRTSM